MKSKHQKQYMKIKMNNKGQSLITFVLFLPAIILLFTLIWEVGNLSLTTNKYEKEIKSAINYGLNNLNQPNINEKINNLLKANIEGNIKVEINNGIIKINVKQKYNALYNFNNHFDIDITYIGYKENNKIIIKKE